MWQRSELKTRAKEIIRKYFWAAVVVCLVSGLFAGEFGSSSSLTNNINSENSNVMDTARDIVGGTSDFAVGDVTERVGNGLANILTAGLFSIFLMFSIGFFVIAILVSIFIGAPILVGSKRFFMKSRVEKTSVGALFYVFKSGHMLNTVLIMFVQNLKLLLWTLLLIVPGIIKSYEYRMIPYILSENPEIEMKRAFELSREMMTGQKWDTFVLDISFILWNILGAITCGLANVLFVNPYTAATNAELYAVLRERILSNGYSNTFELPGF